MKLQTTDLIDLKKYPINKSNQQKRKLLKLKRGFNKTPF